MKLLEEEALEFFAKDNGLYTSYSVKTKEGNFTPVVSEERAIQFVKESKYVQAEKIKAQIEVLKMTHLRLSVEGIYNADNTIVFTINELEQQLKSE